MLSIDFEILSKKLPQYAEVWDGIRHWVQAHPTTPYLDTRAIAGDIHVPNEPLRLAQALYEMAKILNLELVYKVINPTTNQYVPGEWHSVTEVPEFVRDPFLNEIDVRDARVVEILRPARKPR